MKKFFFFLVFINICLNGQSNLQEPDRGVYPRPRSLLNVKVDTSYMPMYIGNSYQYIQSGYGGGTVYCYLRYGTVLRDTLIQSQKYFYYSYDNSNHWFRYSEEYKKLYKRLNEADLVYMDFNKEPGDTFVHLNYQYPAVVLSGDTNLFSTNFQYKGFLVSSGPGGTKKELFASGLGLYYTSYESQIVSSYSEYDLIMAKLSDSLGNNQNFTNHRKPQISLTPITLIDSSNFKLSFNVTHEYNRIFPPGHISMFFLDSIKLESYYSKEDSVIMLPLINASGGMNYSVSATLDTLLMKDGFTYNYRIIANDKGLIPETSYSPDTGYYKCVWNGSTGIDDDIQYPQTFSLSQNYPNPFNPSTKISWQTPVGSWQTLKVFDVLGREIATLVDEYRNAGSYNVQFSMNNLSTGIYFYQLKAGAFIETKKMILIK